MIIELLRWLLALAFFGVLGYPIAFHFLRFLPGRGGGFALPLGLILSGYFYWLFAMLGLTGAGSGGVMMGLLACGAISGWCLMRHRFDLRDWLCLNGRHTLRLLILFFAAFGLILMFRLADPAISGTEKPMEMTFINGILRSDDFPPHDSWLSGYGISYYYFGYILSALLIRVSSVASAAGFNLMLATTYGMAAAAAFELVHDLLSHDSELLPRLKHQVWAWCAPVFVLLSGNLEGLFEVLHARGLFRNADGSSAFWEWLNLQELIQAPAREPSFNPTLRPGIWWWRASRVISDTRLDGINKEIIDEFPFFSFYLGDLHPHVLGIPFAMLAIAAALNVFYQILRRDSGAVFWGLNISGAFADGFSIHNAGKVLRFLRSPDFWFAAFCIGALIFMNTWDFPFYFLLYCGAMIVALWRVSGWTRELLWTVIGSVFSLGIACILLFWLFLLGLSSQASGIIPSGVFTTRTIHLVIMFGLFLFPVLVWLHSSAMKTSRSAYGHWLKIAGIVFFALFLLSTLLFGMLIGFNDLGPSLQASGNVLLNRIGAAMQLGGSVYAESQGALNSEAPLLGFLIRRLETLPTMMLLFGALAAATAILSTFVREPQAPAVTAEAVGAENKVLCASDNFAAILLLVGFGLIVIPEFFYLRDLFGWRMNTIFKFYYQAWILLGLSAAYLWARLNRSLSGFTRVLVNLGTVALLLSALVYPFWGILTRAESFSQKVAAGAQNLTLNGAEFLERSRPDDWAGIEWLRQAEPGVVTEKVGSSYTSDNAVSTFSGLPAILGPKNHESQWRGGYTEIGTREEDVRQLYESRSWATASELIAHYQVRYIFIGSAERGAYTVQEQKFSANLTLVFSSGNCRIYQVY